MTNHALDRSPICAADGEQQVLNQIEKLLANQPADIALIVSPIGEAIEIPEALYQILRQAVHHLTHDEAVAIVPVGKELTSQQAADLLNVSRPYLIQLLDEGEIPYYRVGTHRRIEFGDVMTYKLRRDRDRREGLSELTRLSQKLGLYDTSQQNQ